MKAEAPSRLFGVVGVMASWHDGYMKVTETADEFGGFFIQEDESDNIRGNLVDRYGESRIEGLISAEEFSFSKRYAADKNGARAPIFYRFSREGEKWVGTYQMTPDNYGGVAECVTFEAPRAIFGIQGGNIIRFAEGRK